MKKFLLAAALSMTALSVVPSHAAVIVTDVEMPANTIAYISVPGGITANVYMGLVDFYDKGKLVFKGYCFDLFHEITLGAQSPSLSYDFGTLTTDGDNKAISPNLAEEIGYLADHSGPSASDEEATQGAIWDLLGATVTDAALANAIQGKVTLAETLKFPSGTIPITIQSLDGHQSFVSGVPEPATWAMMLVGFGAIGFAMRRPLRKVAVPFA